MTRLVFIFVIVCCCLALDVYPAYGCRYNVREVGFIDVGIDPYHVFGYVPKETSPEAVSGLRATMDTALIDTNIRFEPVSAGADANRPEMQFVASHKISRFPAAVLVSPDGQSRPIDLAETEGRFEERLSSAMESVLNSPVRQAILRKSAESYGVVLLIEGPVADDNQAAREAVSAAIGRIDEQLEFLPKPIARPPEQVVLDRQSLAREEVLLWSLGLKPQDVNEPCVAVFYARGRWIGPLFKGDAIRVDHLTELLFVIGADCECGLDHRWLQGTMLPAKWDGDLQAKAAESLGFDPENPMVKMEMVSIIRRGMGGFDYPGVPFGYQEIEVSSEVPDPGTQIETEVESEIPDPDVRIEAGADSEVPVPGTQTLHASPEKELSTVAPRPDVVQEQAEPGEEGLELGVLAVSLGGMVALVAVASAFILIRAKKA